MKKPNISKALTSLRLSAQKYSPEILTGIGIAGMIVTTVMAVRATPKALILIEDKKEELKENRLTPIETVKTVGVCYIPTAVIGTVSIACLIGASSVNLRRRAALVTAYTLSESALKEYQEKVVETIGEKKEQAIRDEIAKDKVTKNPPVATEVLVTNAGKTLFYDPMNDRYFQCNIEKLRRVENTLNYRMRQEMFISLNEFYYEIGLKGVRNGDEMGWNIDRGEIRFNFSAQLITDEESVYYGQPCIVIDYDYCMPRYDYRHLM